MPKLDGRNALITGASSGIGQAIAVRFAQEGANVGINYRNGAEQAEATRKVVDQTYATIGKPERKAIVVQADVSNENQETLYACGGLTLYPEFRLAWSSGE